MTRIEKLARERNRPPLTLEMLPIGKVLQSRTGGDWEVVGHQESAVLLRRVGGSGPPLAKPLNKLRKSFSGV